MDFEYTLYLMPNGEFYITEKHSYSDEYTNAPPESDYIKLDYWWDKKDSDRHLDHWIKDKEYHLKQGYSNYYLITKINKLEEKLNKLMRNLGQLAT